MSFGTELLSYTSGAKMQNDKSLTLMELLEVGLLSQLKDESRYPVTKLIPSFTATWLSFILLVTKAILIMCSDI